MTVARIKQAVNLDVNRFLILYGEGIEDTFITGDLQLMNIEEALQKTLQDQGFERIAFISPHQPVYFLDENSKILSTPQGMYDKTSTPTGEMRILRDGPLSNRFLLPVTTQSVDPSTFNEMGDVHALRWLDTMIRDEFGPKSAVVFMQAESTLTHFEDRRTLAGLVGNWIRLPARNQNICILLFSSATYEQLSEAAQGLPVPEIRDLILHNQPPNRVLRKIGVPDAAELNLLLQHLQQQGLLRLRENARSISEWLSTEGISIHQWISRLASIDYLDRSVARQSGWISAVNDPECSAEERLSGLVGLHRIKQHLSELTAWLYLQMQRDEKSETPMLHMVFVGNPGTGKTTVARLIGELYRNIGILKRGHLIEAKAADLVADHVGGTTGRTDKIIDQALDGVLFIDEAYILTEPDRGGFGHESVDTLLSRMENDRGRLVVIVAGYPEKMNRFLKSNPGLARRFPLENHYDFPDFTPEELSQILFGLLTERAIPVETGMQKHLIEIIEGLYRARDDTFGNAGEMRNLCDAVDRRRAARIVHEKVPINAALILEDLPSVYQSYLNPQVPEIDRLFDHMDELVGLQTVKSYLRRLAHRLEFEQIRNQQSLGRQVFSPLQHLVFIGNPGTGKTTVARLVGRLFQSLGLLRKGHVIEVSRHDLVAGYVGQTAIKTMERVKAALDGVLFIDEAYSLNNGGANDFGQESIDTLVKAMEDYRERLVVVVAGYPQEMNNFLNSNPGLRSRFSQPLPFPDYTLDEMEEILKYLAARDGYMISTIVTNKVLEYIESIQAESDRSFGNARTVQAIFECMKDALAERVLSNKDVYTSADSLSTFLIEDVPVPASFIPRPTKFPYLPAPTSYENQFNRKTY